MFFYPYGPFTLPRGQDGLLSPDLDERRWFWEEIDECFDGLPGACGCYIFAIRSGGGTLPWYVGKAERQSFRKEVLTADKERKYNSVLEAVGRGTPILFFYARLTSVQEKFSQPRARYGTEISYSEKMLISLALARNSDLVNRQDTKLLREMRVPGLLNSGPGRLPAAAEDLKAVLGI